MSQSRALSAVEAAVNVLIGWLLATATQLVVFPVYGLSVSMAQNLQIGAIFTILSLARSYALRRVFVWLGRA